MEPRPLAPVAPLEMVRGMARSEWGVEYQRRSLPRDVKAAVWSFTWGQCWYCGTNYLNPFETLVMEHVIPLCRGGDDEIENVVPACIYCNQSKGTMLLEEWRVARPDGDDPDNYPWLREYDSEDCPYISGRFWFERDSLWEGMRAQEIQIYRRMRKPKCKGFG